MFWKKQGLQIEPVIARVAGEHHERFGGQGYPLRKRGRYEEDPTDGIHIYSRIIAIADVYSAMLMNRVYRPEYSPAEVLKRMGTMAPEYDPAIFSKFLRFISKNLAG